MLYILLYIHNIFAWSIILQELNQTDIDISNWNSMDSSLELQKVDFCNQYLLKINDGQEIQRSVTISNQDVTQLRIEADLYFIHYTDSKMVIKVNGVVINDQVFSQSQIQLNENFCEETGQHYFTQIDIISDFEIQANNIIQIYYSQIIINESSIFGVRNFILYTNGVAMNCPSSAPIISSSQQCTSFCENGQQLKTPFLISCYGSAQTTSSSIIKTYPDELDQNLDELTTDIWQITDESSINDQDGASIIANDNFPFPGGGLRIILQGIIYLFGDWEDGSYIRFQLNCTVINSDSTITTDLQQEKIQIDEKTRYYYKYQTTQQIINKISCDTSQCQSNQLNQTISTFEFLTINKTNGKFELNPTNLFDVYDSHLILQNGSRIPVIKVILNSEAQVYYASTAKEYSFTIRQKLKGQSAQFAIQNKMYLYQVSRNDNICKYFFQTSCYSCVTPYFAYLGKCVLNCPIYSQVSQTNRNCTDLINNETLQYTKGITQNSSGVYLIKEFYDSQFTTSSIEKVFDEYPSNDNYFTSQKYSNLNYGKIVGGFSSWGYGSYIKYFYNLPYHYQIRIYCRLYFIDHWSLNDVFYIFIDETKYEYTINELTGQQIQGNTISDYYKDIFIRHAHYDDQLKIKFTCFGNDYIDSRFKSCGINNLFVLYDRNVNYLCPQQNEFYQQYAQICQPCSNAPNGCIQYMTLQFYKCDYHCFTCAQNPKNCLSCDPALRREFDQTTNWCNCISGYYEIENQPQCQECPINCKLCNFEQCLQCSENRQLIKGQCQCANEYYEVNQICCKQICGSCDLSGNCLSCVIDQNRILEQGQCVCQIGFTQQENSNICIQIICDQTCATCFGESKLNCLTCDEQDFRILKDNQCLCKQGYLEEKNGICKQEINCHPTCATCFGELQMNCLSCDQQEIVFRSLQNNQCLCLDGYSEDEKGICQSVVKCHPTCSTCDGKLQQNCLSCDDITISFRQFNNNQCLCTEGYQEDQNYKCQLIQNCFYACNKCKEQNNKYMCIDCQQFRELTSTNQCECIQGYKELNNKCVDQKTFDEYIYLNQQCDDGNVMPRDGCYLYNIEPYWFCTKQTLKQFSICQQCTNYCLNCVNQICIQCKDGYYLFDNQCFKCSTQCQTCQNTQNTCLTCSDQSQQPINFSCRPCDIGYYLIDNICQTVCGDAILVANEQCDDGNHNDLDGCSHNCLIESLYQCQDTSCILKPTPTKQIKYEQNQLSLGFNSVISKCDYITIWIEGIQSNQFQYNISQLVSNNYDLECQVNFTFFSDIDSNNIIHALLKKNARLLAQNNDVIEILITPQKQYYFTDVQKENSLIVYYLYQLLLYFVWGLLPLSIIFQKFDYLDLDFLIQTSYLYYFDLDFSLYFQQFLVIQPIQLIPFLNYPFTIYNQQYHSSKRSIKRIEDQFIISNIWTLIFILIPFIISLKIISKIKRSKQTKTQNQVRPTTTKNTKTTQFTFREEQVKYPNEKNKEWINNKNITDSQIKIYKIENYLLNTFKITIIYSILVQLSFLSEINVNNIYFISNLLILVIVIGYIGFQFKKLVTYFSLKNVQYSYRFVSDITIILSILSFLVLKSKQLYVTCICFLLQFTKICYLGYHFRVFKFKDIFSLLQLSGMIWIAYIQHIDLLIEAVIMGFTYLYAAVNVFVVIYNILKQYL